MRRDAFFASDRRELIQVLSRHPSAERGRELERENQCQRFFALNEPYPHWTETSLQARAACYARTGNPRLGQATADIAAHFSTDPMRLGIGLENR